jgi:PKD repeat protein
VEETLHAASRAFCWTLVAALAAACSSEPPTEPVASPSVRAAAGAGGDRFVPGRLLVQFRPGANGAAIAQAQGAVLGSPVALGIQVVHVPPGKELENAARFRGRSEVVFAEPDWLRTLDDPLCPTCTLPNDGLLGYKWDLHNDGTINNPSGTELATTGLVDADIDWLEAFNLLGSGFAGTARVAILDTGVRTTHEDLTGRIVAQYDFYNNDADATDDQGHGTHVAGIAAAAGNNAKGLTGVAYGSGIGIMAAKVCTPTFFGLNAECPSSAIIAGIMWAADNGANVINLSLGGTEASVAEQQALQYARDHNVLPLCAAGNSGQAGVLFPAAFPECVAVTATDWGDGLASYSNWGPEVLLAAPGGDTEQSQGYSQIASTCFGSNTNYCLKAGTSMATPQVAGLATLLFALGLTDDAAVLDRMQATADDLGDPGWDEQFGHGRINAFRAVDSLDGGGGPPTNQAPTADFTSSCAGGSCDFTDASTDSDGTVASWSWTFGDGGTSTAQNPTHEYACGGSYTVTLTVTDDDGALDSVSKVVTVTGAGAAPGVPSSVPDLVLWLQAEALAGTADGSAVATWPDLSGLCNHAGQNTLEKRPLYRTNQINGLPALVFDATDDGMTTTVDPGLPLTVVAVYASRAGTTGHLLNGGSRFFMGPYSGRYRNYTGGYATGPVVVPADWVVQTLRQSSGRAELWMDGVFTAWTKKNADPSALLLARQGTYSQKLDGSVAEVLVYNRTLSDAELQSVHEWLLARYTPAPQPNQPPVASFTEICTDLSCTFTDTSTDPDGTVASRSWNFGDGGTSTATNPSHSYAAAGTYTVMLEVTDDDGAPSSTSHGVTVTEPPPPGPFVDPSSVPDLKLWLRADAITGLADGTPMATWPGSGGGVGATQSTASRQPLYRTGQVNGLPAVVFDATDDGMATTFNSTDKPITVFVVYASRAGATGYVLNGGSSFFMGPYSGLYRNWTSAFANGPSVTAGRWLQQTLRQSSSLSELFVDGVFQMSVTNTANPGSILLARQGTYSQKLDGSVAEVIAYDRTLTDLERSNVEGWLRTKYALP